MPSQLRASPPASRALGTAGPRWRWSGTDSRLRRFTITPDQVAARHVAFDRDETRHLARVLRLRPGDVVLATDGAGRQYTVRLESIGDLATGTVLDVAARSAESPLALTLIQGIPKGEKMDAIVRAVTELGVARVCPAVAERTIVALAGDRWGERARRWQRIAKEAAKQCGRTVVPAVATPRPLADWVADAEPADLRLCLWEDEARSLGPLLDSLASRPVSARVIVGPEGGLAPAEVAHARLRGFVTASLGPRILRTETAGPAVVAILQARFGDLGSGG
jgi:16S rRNA (uracil1498-N3)-methyltransferase